MSFIPTANQIRRQFIDFFVKFHKHAEIPSASLIPENDPTVLFTTAGMHPLVPYLMGEPHPAGRRLVNCQKCVRTNDIDEVGDAVHLTFFEMLGNWSLDDYFKESAIEMSFNLLTLAWDRGGFGLDKEKIAISCFAGDKDAPRDTESAGIWIKMGIPKERIFFYPKPKNWWGPAGQTGPCGPDTEMFYDTMGDPDITKHNPKKIIYNTRETGLAFKKIDENKPCDPNCDCGRYVELWNDVFLQYNRKLKVQKSKVKNADQMSRVEEENSENEASEYEFGLLKQRNVDTGLGFERLVAVLQNKPSPFETELFAPAIEKIKDFMKEGGVDYGIWEKTSECPIRIVADHLRAATFILGDPLGVSPSNVDQGYIVRRLVRRAIRHGKQIGINKFFASEIAKIYISQYSDIYPELAENRDRIISELDKEEEQFHKTLEKGLKQIPKLLEGKKAITGADVFYMFETYGFPLEMTMEELSRIGHKGPTKDIKQEFDEAYEKHKQMSRTGAEQKFSGGLADHSEAVTMHHTATHLLHQALRDVLGPHVAQKGSNVTAERLRFDFVHPQKMTPEQIKKVEDIVNEQISKNLPVKFEMLTVEEAKSRGAIGLFEEKYEKLGNQVKVYSIGEYSKEICGGPHVANTGVLKHFKVLKEEAVSAGVRRIKAVAEGVKDA